MHIKSVMNVKTVVSNVTFLICRLSRLFCCFRIKMKRKKLVRVFIIEYCKNRIKKKLHPHRLTFNVFFTPILCIIFFNLKNKNVSLCIKNHKKKKALERMHVENKKVSMYGVNEEKYSSTSSVNIFLSLRIL